MEVRRYCKIEKSMSSGGVHGERPSFLKKEGNEREKTGFVIG